MTPSATRKLLAPLACGALLLSGVPAEATSRSPDVGTQDSGITRDSSTAQQRAGATDYWSPERMEAATPLGRVLDSPSGSGGERSPQSAASDDSTGERWDRGGKVTKTTGKVYLTMDGRDFTCSGSVVRADNRDTVLTAGHCLKDGTGAWAENWTFVPGYEDGSSPHGRYSAREKLVPRQWSQQEDDSFDVGLAVVGTDDGNHVQDEVGAQRIAFGQRPGDPTYAFGYPATDGYSGRYLHYCAGDTRPDQDGTTASGMDCEMTQGSSGGPWLSGFDPETGTGTVTSVISFKYASDPTTQYGPFLGDEVRRLYREAQAL
ncbi:trypsin-like peptidase [Haloactinospora alba]|uniref:Trypsin-like peptidase n=1 Tax=Haloactinospora alba TaxID=405555 RepID=A0A543NGE3_9ACTN|nr:trypsin-like peptidase domain-containing protein [Haloactinospora alba]TQN30874.1 trypsin-like peptidase [Haloactinospora alba]